MYFSDICEKNVCEQSASNGCVLLNIVLYSNKYMYKNDNNFTKRSTIKQCETIQKTEYCNSVQTTFV